MQIDVRAEFDSRSMFSRSSAENGKVHAQWKSDFKLQVSQSFAKYDIETWIRPLTHTENGLYSEETSCVQQVLEWT